MKLIYDVEDRPTLLKVVTLAFQQILAILAATLAIPLIVGNGISFEAAMFGAGAGTIVYLLLSRRKSPILLGSSISYIGSMFAAFAGAASAASGMAGIILGAVFAGLIYVVLALVVKKTGVGWIDRFMPPAVIGPVVSVIGLSLASTAVDSLKKGNVMTVTAEGEMLPVTSEYIAILCGLVTLAVTILASVYGSKNLKLLPFLTGMCGGYLLAAVLTVAGIVTGIEKLQVINFNVFSDIMLKEGRLSLSSFVSLPDFTFIKAVDGIKELKLSYVITIFSAYVPVAFVSFAEHIADHKNMSLIINRDLLKDPGLHRTLLGDGLGSIAGAFFGGCPNTTYGESIACVALSGNASVITIFAAAAGCMLLSFLTPLVALLSTVPDCVMGGICLTAYGFIAVSGLKMLKKVDLDDVGNIYTCSVILIAGIGGLSISFGSAVITPIATSLILGILTNLLVSGKKKKTG